jgi:hypothetical protein
MFERVDGDVPLALLRLEISGLPLPLLVRTIDRV